MIFLFWRLAHETSVFLQTDLDWLNNWFSYNKLSLNIPKCEVMNFGVGTPDDLTRTNEKLPKRNAYKHLGVNLDKKLIFHDHLEYVVKKLNKFNGLIYKVHEIYPIECLLLFNNCTWKLVFSYAILTYRYSENQSRKNWENPKGEYYAHFFSKISMIVLDICLNRSRSWLYSNYM